MNLKNMAGVSFGLITFIGSTTSVVIAHYAENWLFAFVVASLFSIIGGTAVFLAVEQP